MQAVDPEQDLKVNVGRAGGAGVALLLLVGCAGQTIATRPVNMDNSGPKPVASIAGLGRGQSVQVPLTINNPNQDPIRVHDVVMRVVSVSKMRCPTEALQLRTFPQAIVAAQSAGVVLLTVAVESDAPAVCDTARWVVEFASQASSEK